jgi:rod shape-determining protein MreC
LRNLFVFIFKNVHWLLFCIFIYLSVLLIVNNNQFQRSKYLQVMREVTGNIYSVTNRFSAYLYLRSTNTELSERLAKLTAEVYDYRRRLEMLEGDSGRIDGPHTDLYRFISAQVINNSVSFHENYMTLDKGSDDGIRPDMGVLSPRGVVGVVVSTSPHFSTVISLLNTKYKLNGKLKHNDYYGPLVWDGRDSQHSYLTEIPRYAEYQAGDTIVTSGYSTVFPKGIPVGAIVEVQRQQDDNYRTLRIRLFTNFNNLREVLIVDNRLQQEQKELEAHTLNLETHH